MKKPKGGVELYLVRHEISAKNLEPDIICGRSDHTPLVAEGVRRAKLLGDGLSQLGIWPDLVLTSPADRARDTAAHALSAMGYRMQPIADADLHEVSQGDWEGLSRADIYTPEIVSVIRKDPRNFTATGGESINMAGVRMNNFLGRMALASEHLEERLTVMAFTHGYATAILVGQMLGWTTEEMRDRSRTPNGSLTRLDYGQGAWAVQYVGKTPDEIMQNGLSRLAA